VRLYRAEEDLALAILLDSSASMAWGKPAKGRLAAQLAGALSFIALQSGDRVSLTACQAGGVVSRLDHLRGANSTWPAWRLLQTLDYAGATDLNAALTASARHLKSGGLSVVLTDLFSPTGYQQGIDALLGRRQDVLLVHVLSPDEVEPPADLVGEWRLLDSEPGAPVEATITPGVVRSYRRLLNQFTAEAADFCRRRGVTYLLLRSDADLHDILLRTFRTAGILV
jgi:uncharacterized protein (DUF58 family)